MRIALDLTIEGDRARYDLSRSAPQADGAINSTRSMAQSALMVATKAIFPHVPASEGMFDAIDIVNPEGLVTNARFPASISGAFATSYEVICACVFGAYLQMRPERSMVCGGNMTNMVVGGYDPRAGYERDFVMYLWKEGGYGARPGKKDNHTAISLYASGTRNEPVEVQERVYPILTHRYEFIPDSAGAGLHRGGIGVTRDFELTHGDATLSVLGCRGVEPVWGYEGGDAALGSGLIHDGGATSELGVMRSGVTARKGHAHPLLGRRRRGLGRPADAAGRVGARGRHRRLRDDRSGAGALRSRRRARSTRTRRCSRSTRRRPRLRAGAD